MRERQEEDLGLVKEQHPEVVQKHLLMIWASLTPGDVIYVRSHGSQYCVGTVECSTSDGLIIWLRDDLNHRRLFHFHDCQSIRVIR
jgi:hypothetical protein